MHTHANYSWKGQHNTIDILTKYYIYRERVWVDIQRQTYLGESWFIIWLIQAAVATPPVTGLLFFFQVPLSKDISSINNSYPR